MKQTWMEMAVNDDTLAFVERMKNAGTKRKTVGDKSPYNTTVAHFVIFLGCHFKHRYLVQMMTSAP